MLLHSLGVLLDPGLLLDAQVVPVARSASYQLELVNQDLIKNVLTSATHPLAVSWLDYCNERYVGLPLKMGNCKWSRMRPPLGIFIKLHLLLCSSCSGSQ